MDDRQHAISDAIEEVLRDNPGLSNTELRTKLRGRGIFVEGRALGTILHQDDRFTTLGDGIRGWYLVESFTAAPTTVFEPASDAEFARRSKAIWEADTSAEEILRLLDGP